MHSEHPKRGFDPLFKSHKRDLPTLTNYVRISSLVYGALLIGYPQIIKLTSGKIGTDNFFTAVMIFYSILLAFSLGYTFSVYREYLSVFPKNEKTRTKYILLVGWVIVYFLVGAVEIVVTGMSTVEPMVTSYTLGIIVLVNDLFFRKLKLGMEKQ